MLNPAVNANLGDWTPASYTVPQNPITDAFSSFLSGLGSLIGGGGHAAGGGLGAFTSVYDVTGYPILGPYDRIWAAIQRQEKDEAELNKSYFDQVETGMQRPDPSSLSGLPSLAYGAPRYFGYGVDEHNPDGCGPRYVRSAVPEAYPVAYGLTGVGMGDWTPASIAVPENPVYRINGLNAAMTLMPTPSHGEAVQGNTLGAISYGGLGACGGGRGGCGCSDCGGGMGTLADFLPDGMPDFLQGTVLGMPAWAVYGGGALMAYVLLSRGGGYREEKRAAGEAYRRRVRRAKSSYGRGYERARDAYREARGAA
jgi:hypothetical protein